MNSVKDLSRDWDRGLNRAERCLPERRAGRGSSFRGME